MLDTTNLNFDIDGDGIPDVHADTVDFNGDGIPDMFIVDTNGDGIGDTVFYDQNQDGIIDQIIYGDDSDASFGDHFFDHSDELIDDGGVLTDIDGDGIADGVGYDTSGDGQIDTIYVDSDHDGIPDTMMLDTDHNGTFDQTVVSFDSDGNGTEDSLAVYHDYDDDGTADNMELYQDTNDDGIYDVLVKAFDSDGSGEFDTFKTYIDHDENGTPDEIIEEQFIDTDGDGIADKYLVQHDIDGDGQYDDAELYDYNSLDGTLELLAVEDNYDSVLSEGYGNFDPVSCDPDSVSGNPAHSMREWEFQGDTNRCALYSQKFVIEELTGRDIDIEELADLAESNGWFSEDNGTPILNMDKVLNYYGIDSNMSFNNDISDIQNCLENGGKVIVAIDADEVWYGESNDLFDPSDDANHAVEVIGIDHSDLNNPMVILNDSGHPDGCGELVPMDIFLDAWEDGNCQMIACM